MSQAYANLLGEHHYFVSVITKWEFCSNARANLLWIVVWDIYTLLFLEIVIGIIQIGLYLVSRFIVRSLVLVGKVHYTVTYDAYLR